jgi:hypothetical protein
LNSFHSFQAWYHLKHVFFSLFIELQDLGRLGNIVFYLFISSKKENLSFF